MVLVAAFFVELVVFLVADLVTAFLVELVDFLVLLVDFLEAVFFTTFLSESFPPNGCLNQFLVLFHQLFSVEFDDFLVDLVDLVCLVVFFAALVVAVLFVLVSLVVFFLSPPDGCLHQFFVLVHQLFFFVDVFLVDLVALAAVEVVVLSEMVLFFSFCLLLLNQ